MIYTLGDSFTKWHWPTWSDWLSEYIEQPIENWAFPGNSNEHVYYTLLEKQNTFTKHDTIYIMWTGNHRVCEWYDPEYIDQTDIMGFFPSTQGKLWLTTNTPYCGFYKTHHSKLPSLTHMIVSNFDIILKTQWLLETLPCDYRMMFWQNPWADARDVLSPNYKYTWNTRPGDLTNKEKTTALEILKIDVVKQLLKNILWKKFISTPSDVSDPNTYAGLWEFTVNNSSLLTLNHITDPHPNTFAHHQWVTEKILPDTDPIYHDQSHAIALAVQKQKLPEMDYRSWGILTPMQRLCNIKIGKKYNELRIHN